MFTGLILLALVSFLAVTVVASAIKAAFRAVRKAGGKEEPKEKSDGKAEEKKTPEKKPEEKTSVKEEVREEKAEPTVESEEMERLKARGITEVYWNGYSALEIDGKTLADLAVARSKLSYVEFNNRHLAGEEFHGFNIEVKDGEKMALTYRGQVLSTLTRIVEKTTEIVDGKDEERESVKYRTNTFPPLLGKDMCVSELAELLEVTRYIQSCGGEPCRVADAMLDSFLREGNVSKLKFSIDDKIRRAETLKLRDSQEKSRNEAQPKKLKIK